MYAIHMNGKKAARLSGYAEQGVYALMRNPAVAAMIQQRIRERAEALGATPSGVLRELARVANANLSDAVEWGPKGVRPIPSSELDPDTAAAIKEVEESIISTPGKDGQAKIRAKRSVKMHDKVTALRTLAQILGMLKTSVEVSGPGGQPLLQAAQSLSVDDWFLLLAKLTAAGVPPGGIMPPMDTSMELPVQAVQVLVGDTGETPEPPN